MLRQPFTQLKRAFSGPIQSSKKSRFLRAGAGIAITSTALLYYLGNLKAMKSERIEAEFKKVESLGMPKLGGPFKLIDHSGTEFDSDRDLKGKLAILYFGFTHCPDVCPDELDKMGKVVEGLSQRQVRVEPLFITVDPKRDTPSVMSSYLKDFNSHIRGLSVAEGSPTDSLQAAAKAFRVYFKPAQTSASPSDYLLDHSIFYYLLKDGQFVKVYGRSASVDEMINDICSHA